MDASETNGFRKMLVCNLLVIHLKVLFLAPRLMRAESSGGLRPPAHLVFLVMRDWQEFPGHSSRLMATSLIPGLSFSHNLSCLPLGGQLLLITDHLASPADFILHRALALQLKQVQPTTHHPRVILVSIASDFAHWCAIAAKSNVNLGYHLKTGSLTYIDGLSLSAYPSPELNATGDADDIGYVRCHPLFENGTREPSLKELYDVVAQSLQGNSDEAISQMVIMDDITLLELIGVPSIVIARFVRAAYALCRQHAAGLVIRAHVSSSSNADFGIPFDSDLLRVLVDVCHMHIEVRPLASGRSGAVSGEIAAHGRNLALIEGGQARTGRKASVQYRLNDGGVAFFQKGMGAGVI